MEKWEPKFSDTLGMIYNEFCHNLNFKSNSKLKHWSNDDVMVISNNETDVILDYETGLLPATFHFYELATSMLMTNVGDEMCWRDLGDIQTGFASNIISFSSLTSKKYQQLEVNNNHLSLTSV